MTMREVCLFCGGRADTEEDVIPKWFLRRYPVAPRVILPNGTRMLAARMKVPACARDNNEVFAEIEERIKAGNFTPDQAYLWALKIHAGLSYLDMRLRADRSDPQSGPMPVLGLTGEQLDRFYAEEIERFREFVRVWKTPNRQFRPSPPGSVFVLDSFAPNIPDWVHGPIGAVGVNLGDKFLAVVLFDGGLAKRVGGFDRY